MGQWREWSNLCTWARLDCHSSTLAAFTTERTALFNTKYLCAYRCEALTRGRFRSLVKGGTCVKGPAAFSAFIVGEVSQNIQQEESNSWMGMVIGRSRAMREIATMVR